MVASLGALTSKAVGKLATTETLATPNITTFPTTLTPDQGLENFTDSSPLHNTTADPIYSPVQVGMVLALLAGLWQVGRLII